MPAEFLNPSSTHPSSRHSHEASRIAMKWLRLIAKELVQTGVIRERRNVVDRTAPVPGRYPPRRGFAWTNGVYTALLAQIIFGIEVAWNGKVIEPRPNFPPEWGGEQAEIYLPSYPWPNQNNLGGIS